MIHNNAILQNTAKMTVLLFVLGTINIFLSINTVGDFYQ